MHVCLQECTRAVGLLVSETCPAHELVLQQHLGKLLTYLRKQMQASSRTSSVVAYLKMY